MMARVRKSLDENQKGFTLVELLVVVIIIGILAAIAIPVYLGQQNKARDSATKADLANAKTSLVVAIVEDPDLPVTIGGDITETTGFDKSPSTESLIVDTYNESSNEFCLEAVSTSSKATAYHTRETGGILDGLC